MDWFIYEFWDLSTEWTVLSTKFEIYLRNGLFYLRILGFIYGMDCFIFEIRDLSTKLTVSSSNFGIYLRIVLFYLRNSRFIYEVDWFIYEIRDLSAKWTGLSTNFGIYLRNVLFYLRIGELSTKQTVLSSKIKFHLNKYMQCIFLFLISSFYFSNTINDNRINVFDWFLVYYQM